MECYFIGCSNWFLAGFANHVFDVLDNEMRFQTKIKGIPCLCEVVKYYPPKPMKITGSGFGDAEPPEGAELVYRILDRKGYKAPWLESKMNQDDYSRLIEEFQLEVLGERYGYLQ